MSELLTKVSARYVKPTFTEVKVGDTVRVFTRITEGEKTRTQYFEGLVIRRRGGIGTSGTFTVRRIASGVGVERTFPVHSPLIEHVEIQRAAKVRRATLLTMRGLTGKAARLTEQPVDRKARQTEHPWLDKYGLKDEVEEIVAVEEVEEIPEEEIEAAKKGADEADGTDEAKPAAKEDGKEAADEKKPDAAEAKAEKTDNAEKADKQPKADADGKD